ncbi:hypothetical protein MKZ38_005742 [Zalerion maritima]|uniref:Uncharacterized protein n=1 Tax=Zalerion maritima TaxID=339359 RepID=A0AAD5RQ66_9PEZI|nr:hypothetical protein MKZ38_005742 [Zalerion maritima]
MGRQAAGSTADPVGEDLFKVAGRTRAYRDLIPTHVRDLFRHSWPRGGQALRIGDKTDDSQDSGNSSDSSPYDFSFADNIKDEALDPSLPPFTDQKEAIPIQWERGAHEGCDLYQSNYWPDMQRHYLSRVGPRSWRYRPVMDTSCQSCVEELRVPVLGMHMWRQTPITYRSGANKAERVALPIDAKTATTTTTTLRKGDRILGDNNRITKSKPPPPMKSAEHPKYNSLASNCHLLSQLHRYIFVDQYQHGYAEHVEKDEQNWGLYPFWEAPGRRDHRFNGMLPCGHVFGRSCIARRMGHRVVEGSCMELVEARDTPPGPSPVPRNPRLEYEDAHAAGVWQTKLEWKPSGETHKYISLSWCCPSSSCRAIPQFRACEHFVYPSELPRNFVPVPGFSSAERRTYSFGNVPEAPMEDNAVCPACRGEADADDGGRTRRDRWNATDVEGGKEWKDGWDARQHWRLTNAAPGQPWGVAPFVEDGFRHDWPTLKDVREIP